MDEQMSLDLPASPDAVTVTCWYEGGFGWCCRMAWRYSGRREWTYATLSSLTSDELLDALCSSIEAALTSRG